MLTTGRIAGAFKRQDWATVLVELIFVIVGVLIALRLDQFAEDRRVRTQEINFLELVSADVSRDIDDLENIEQVMTAVRDFGDEALEHWRAIPAQKNAGPNSLHSSMRRSGWMSG